MTAPPSSWAELRRGGGSASAIATQRSAPTIATQRSASTVATQCPPQPCHSAQRLNHCCPLQRLNHCHRSRRPNCHPAQRLNQRGSTQCLNHCHPAQRFNQYLSHWTGRLPAWPAGWVAGWLAGWLPGHPRGRRTRKPREVLRSRRSRGAPCLRPPLAPLARLLFHRRTLVLKVSNLY